MKFLKKYKLLIIVVSAMFALSGCALLQIPGAIINGVSQVLSGALKVASKFPWWMAI